MADELLYDNLKVGARERGDQVEVGVLVDGAFLAFGAFKAQGFHDDVAEAQAAAEKSKKAGKSSSKSDTAEA